MTNDRATRASGFIRFVATLLVCISSRAVVAADKGTPAAGDLPAPGAAAGGGSSPETAKATAIGDMVAGAIVASADPRFKPVLDRSAWSGKGTIALYFLPDGRPTEPLPSDLSERDDVELYVILPDTMLGAGRLEVTACPDKDPYRVNGDFAAAKKLITAQAILPPSRFQAQRLGKLDCGAGQISFHIGTVDNNDPTKELAGSTSTLTLGAVYWGTVGVQFGFDFTQSGALSVQSSPAGSVISRSDDLLGPKVSVAFLWHPIGLDARHPSAGGILLNPSLGIDLDAITTSFFLGDSICWNGLCFLGAAHLRKSDQLTKTSGLSVGDAYDTTKGSLPVEQRWSSSKSGIGFFGAVVLDVNVAARLLGGTK